MDIQERLTAFAMLGATWVLWLLVLLSIVCLAVVLERAYYLIASGDDVRKLKEDVLRLLGARDVDGARKRLAASKSFEAKVAVAGLDAAADGSASAEEKMQGESALAKLQMERNLAFLGTVGNNAPFVGLLGTVIGIIRAFHSLEQSAGQINSGLMAEIGEALVATAIGIIVALPAVAFFNLFQRLIRARLARGDALGRDVLAFLKSEREEGPAPAPAAQAAE